MKKKFIKITIVVGFVGLQASDKESVQAGSDVRVTKISDSDDEYQNFLSSKEAQAVFFAIKRGFDSQLIQPLVNHALTVCPSSRLFRRDVTQAVKYDSLKVKTLEYEINNGGCKAVKRAALQEELDSIRSRSSFYDKK